MTASQSVLVIFLNVVSRVSDEGDTLGAAGGALECVHRGAIVLAMAARLHDHALVEAEKVAQREELLLWRVAGRVFALGRIGEFSLPGRIRDSVRPRPPQAAGISVWRGWGEMEYTPESSA
jgi:hypothetical protein